MSDELPSAIVSAIRQIQHDHATFVVDPMASLKYRRLRDLILAALAAEHERSSHATKICGAGGNYGAFQEPLACGYLAGHEGPHAWASLPTFVNGAPVPPVGSQQRTGDSKP